MESDKKWLDIKYVGLITNIPNPFFSSDEIPVFFNPAIVFIERLKVWYESHRILQIWNTSFRSIFSVDTV